MVVLLIFAIFFHLALKNASSLYLLKISFIFVILSVLLGVYLRFFLVDVDYINGYEEFRKYTMIASIGNALINILFVYGLAKAFCTLPKHVPQGLNIKI